MERQYDLVIIGAGPAGLSAALYGSRAGLKTLILENGAPGGKLIKTNKISNYPGVKEIEGTQLAMDMFDQATSFQAEYALGLGSGKFSFPNTTSKYTSNPDCFNPLFTTSIRLFETTAHCIFSFFNPSSISLA